MSIGGNCSYRAETTKGLEEIKLEDVIEIEIECFENVSMQEWKDSKEDTKYW